MSYQAYMDTSRTDLNNRLSGDGDGQDAGFSEIAGACVQARAVHLEWLWVDTCCIDKPNSTELSRSINSMFKWYESAQVCFVHLADVDSRRPGLANAIQNSEWFRRGWTLQEMLASRSLQFFDANWQPLGSGRDLAPLLSKGARISEKHLTDFRTASIAQKMSWRRIESRLRRKTPRIVCWGSLTPMWSCCMARERKPFRGWRS